MNDPEKKLVELSIEILEECIEPSQKPVVEVNVGAQLFLCIRGTRYVVGDVHVGSRSFDVDEGKRILCRYGTLLHIDSNDRMYRRVGLDLSL
jgi:hypothetical protein